MKNTQDMGDNNHYTGVSLVKGRYAAHGSKNGMRVHLGTFDTPEEAYAAYQRHYEDNPRIAKKDNQVRRTYNLIKNKDNSDGTTGHRGVSYHKRSKRWEASITFRGKYYYLGCFINYSDAVAAREAAEKYLYHEFLEWYEAYKSPEAELSGCPGVKAIGNGMWEAYITYKGKYCYLGRFDNLGDAIAARKRAEKQLHKEL